MSTSFADRVRAFGSRMLITMLAVTLVCLYGRPAVVPPTRLTTAQVENTAEIVSAPSTIGIADSGLYGETQAQINQTLDTLQSIGVQNIRVFVPWIYVEPANGVYNWSSIDMVIQAAQARNMGVMAEIASTPLWEGSSTAIIGAGTPNPADYASFVTAVAKRYSTAISTYEIWNEPNYVLSSDPIDPTAYAALLKAAYPAIKAVDPSATVVAGALGSVVSFGNITMDPVTFVQEMLAAGAASYFDALSFHPYQESLPFSQGAGVANSPLTQLNALHQLLTQYGEAGMKIWISEFGASTNDVSQQTQADLIKNLIDTWQTIAYAGPVFIYTAQDGVPGADGFGIYNADWTPKLAVAVIQAAIQKYSSNPLGGTTSIFSWVVQSLTNLFQTIQGAFQQLVKAVTSFFTAIFSSLSAVLPASTPVAATVPSAALMTTVLAKPTKATTATADAAQTTGTSGTPPTPAKTRTTGTTTAAGTTGSTEASGTTATTAATTTSAGTDTPSGTTASGPAPNATVAMTTPSSTSESATTTTAGGSTPTSSAKTAGGPGGSATAVAATPRASEKSSASGTNKAAEPSATTGTQGGSPSKLGKPGKSDKTRNTNSDKTSPDSTKEPHDGHSGPRA